MGGVRQAADTAKNQATDALKNARVKTRATPQSPPMGPRALIALQRSAGNAAINALMAGRLRFPGKQATADIDSALREIRRDEPVIDTVEKGLKAAKAAGVPVDLEGVRPPASALAVKTTGFGPGSVPAKKPAPPPKKVPAVSPLGRAAAKKAAPAVKAKGGAEPAPAGAGGGAGSAAALASAPLAADQLLQPPAPPTHVPPDEDPSFTKVKSKVKTTGKAKRAHPPAKSKSKEAQDAALPPAGDVGSQAKAAKADTMDAQRPGTFDKKAFIAAVKAAIEAKSPKTLKEADNYKSSGKTAEVKGEVKGLVTEGKQGQAKDIETATGASPDQSKAVPKPVTPMGPEQQAPEVPIPAAGAVPKPAPPEQLNLAAGKQQANQEMAEGDVTEPQLAQSNEPQFEGALADKKAAAAHADTAPGEYRKQEAEVIQQGKADATGETAKGVNGMQSAKGAALAKLVADKGKAKTKDEAKRAEVTAKIESIFNATEADVKKILEGIDPKVEKEFNEGEAAARATFENYVAGKMSAYKKDRYGGWLGGLRWAKDKLFGMPDKVNEFYVAGRELYLQQMDKVISRIADIVGNDLMAAKKRIADGRNQIDAYVKSLPKDLKKVGADASKEIGERFSQLESEVDSKQESLVDTLASKYVEARKGLDDRIEELQAENKGLVDKAIGAIKAVINTIRELVAMLKNVLSRVAGVVGEIIKHPVAFLGNLIAGIKGGILKFKDNFLDHLRKGLLSWLFGALAEGGIELPDTFDLKGIIKLLASIFGLTWTNIRNRIVKQIGEKAMAAIEKGVEIFQVISTQGVGGLWKMLLEKLGDLKEMILDQVKDFVITKIITAGITWLIGLLNPAAAFIKACKLIYDVVMFFVNNASRIAKFVNTVLDSVSDIVRGNIGSVVNKIDDVLGQMVPIIIGFLASLIGLGDIGKKIREIVEKLQKPVNKAIDFVIKTGLKIAGPLIRGMKSIGSKVKAKLLGGDDSPEGKQKRLVSGVRGGVAAANRFAGKKVGDRVLRPLLGGIRVRYGLSVLEPVKQAGKWAVHGEVQRMTESSDAEVADDEEIQTATLRRETTIQEKNDAHETLNALHLPPGDARATGVQSSLSALDTEYADKSARLDSIKESKKSRPGELEQLGQWFLQATATYEQVRTQILGLKPQQSPAQTEGDKYLQNARNALAQAETALKDPRIIAGVLAPAGASVTIATTPLAKITRARDQLKIALDAAPKTVTTAAQLRQVEALEGPTSAVGKAIDDGRRQIEPASQVAAVLAAVQNVFDETTNYGTVGDRTAEGAAREEIRTNQAVAGLWHGEKCRSYADNLQNIIATIDLQLSSFPARFHAQLRAARARAHDRHDRLDAAATAWYAHQAVTPGFGARVQGGRRGR